MANSHQTKQQNRSSCWHTIIWRPKDRKIEERGRELLRSCRRCHHSRQTDRQRLADICVAIYKKGVSAPKSDQVGNTKWSTLKKSNLQLAPLRQSLSPSLSRVSAHHPIATAITITINITICHTTVAVVAAAAAVADVAITKAK